MALVDRNLLRLGVFEIVFEEQTAHRVSINEAVELAKKFGEHTSIKGKKDVIPLSLSMVYWIRLRRKHPVRERGEMFADVRRVVCLNSQQGC